MGGVRIKYLSGCETFSDQSRSLPEGGYDGLCLFGVRGAMALPYQLMRCRIPLDFLLYSSFNGKLDRLTCFFLSPRYLNRLFDWHCRCDVGNAEGAERPSNLKQCLFIRCVEDCHGHMPADENITAYRLDPFRILEVLPQFAYPVGMIGIEFEP
ncbi:MAG TPA: hypothetical protein VED16_02145 [Candidatus Acidoferrum sp.]|nr:hypothetical protein [Candidatus Acidoferrum sp.]